MYVFRVCSHSNNIFECTPPLQVYDVGLDTAPEKRLVKKVELKIQPSAWQERGYWKYRVLLTCAHRVPWTGDEYEHGTATDAYFSNSKVAAQNICEEN